MDFAWVGQTAPVLVAAATAFAGLTKGQRRVRANVRYDVETLKELPEGSEAYKRLAAHIDDQVKAMAKIETEGTRKPVSAVWCFTFAILFGYGGVLLYVLDHWWFVVGAMIVFVVAVLFLFLGFDYLVLAERDESGNRARPNT